jgi:hypothetical protein
LFHDKLLMALTAFDWGLAFAQSNTHPCFLFQGQPTQGVNNGYLPFPKWDSRKHMPFKGCEEWQ